MDWIPECNGKARRREGLFFGEGEMGHKSYRVRRSGTPQVLLPSSGAAGGHRPITRPAPRAA